MPAKEAKKTGLTAAEKKKQKQENKAKANPGKAAAKKEKADAKRERRWVSNHWHTYVTVPWYNVNILATSLHIS